MTSVGSPQVLTFPVNVTTPINTAIATPLTTPINMGDVYCYSVEVFIPPGPVGDMGFYLTNAGLQILPWSQQLSWFVADNYDHTFPMGLELGSSLSCVSYNTGGYPHTVYFRFLIEPIASYLAAPGGAPLAQLDLSGLGQD